jgi:hypothetical protein
MDDKTIYVKTSKGEDEIHSRTSHLPGDVKRALLLVDGSSTFGEISKRSAPSMRASLGELLQELEKTGYIRDRDAAGKVPKFAIPPKMSIPSKMVTPHKKPPVDEDAGDLDFLTGFPVTPPEKPAIVPENTKSLKEQAEEKSKHKADAENIKAENIKAQKEAEDILRKAEQEAARIREETARRARKEAEATRLKAEQEAKLRLEAAIREQQQAAEATRLFAEQQAKKGREEIESAKVKIEQDAKQRLEAAIREQQLAAEVSRSLADKQVQKEREELEAARLKIEQEARQRLEAAARERERAEAARIKAEQEAAQILREMEIAKKKAEQEAKARLEAEAKAKELARIKAEEEAAIARKAAELLARQEREAAEREAAARAIEAREAAARAAKAIEDSPADGSDEFEFDEFQIEEPQNASSPRKKRPPSKKAGAGDTFAFDPFQVDEPQRAADPQKPRQSAQKSVSTQKPGTTGDTGAVTEPAENKADKERIAREEQERLAAEARTREIAEAQAKVWAEAEERALYLARSNADLAVQQSEHTQPGTGLLKKKARVARIRRAPFAWGKLVGFTLKLGAFLLVLLVGALFIVPYVLPMRDYMPKIQQLLSVRLHQPVHLGKLSGRILPTPRLELGEIYIGDAKQFQAVDAQINFGFLGLFTDAKPISSVELDEVKVRGPWVRNVAAWLQQLANDGQYPVSRMVISQGTLDADVFQITGINGDLNFNPDGKFTQASLRANAGKISVDLHASPDNKLQTAIKLRDSALPMLPNWSFVELDAKGELSNDELLIRDFAGKILGGTVQGNAAINWHTGWRAQGSMSTKSIDMKNINKLLDGNLAGSARFRMASSDLAGLTDSAVLNGSFKANDGLIGGMDIVETARMRSKDHLPGGRTHFDELEGDFSYSNDSYHFNQVKVDAGVMDTTATFDVTKQQLSGKMNVKLSIQDKAAPVDLQIGGAIDSPTLVYAP